LLKRIFADPPVQLFSSLFRFRERILGLLLVVNMNLGEPLARLHESAEDNRIATDASTLSTTTNAVILNTVILRPTSFVGRRIYATGPHDTAAGVHRSFVASPRLRQGLRRLRMKASGGNERNTRQLAP
jgi:hypothetical protein